MTWIVPPFDRVDEPFVADERAMLEGFLDFNRATLLRKCAGLTADQLAMRPLAVSSLSLLGLVRHLAEVERTWFRRRFAGQALGPLHARDDVPEAAFELVDPATAQDDVATLLAEQQAGREAIAGLGLEATFASPRWGTMSLRWVLNHMNSEYARHNGHADLLREHIDGATGV
ncbi:DinB family protein [Nonomuraea sp. NPDC050663]|uniref:DinB family protein n=1 Tax=Nonomuraea sp. NPDC050663 TaxID=3364370 RepID=UPI00379C154E